MSDKLEKRRHELETAQRALAEAEARLSRMGVDHQAAIEKLETVRKQIERAHREWIASLDVVPDPIFLHDKNFRILRCNRAYQRAAGIPFKEIVGQPYYDVFPKTHAPIPNFLQEPENVEAESEIVVGDTTYRSRAYAVTDEQGAYLYSIHSLENINEQQRSKRELKESERQYRRLFESAKDGILILDGDTGKIIDANPFILNLLSYRFEELTGKVLWEIGLVADAEDSKRASKQLLSEEYIRYEHMPLQSKEGRRIEVEFISNLYAVGDHKVIQCNIRDITERLRAKEMLIASYDLLKNVMENTPVRVFWKDAELRFLGCNTAFAHDAGMAKPEDLIGKDDFQMAWKDQAERYRADDKQVMDSGEAILGYEEPQTTPDGNTIWLRTSKVPLRTADGKIFGMLGIYEDITERKEAEKSLKRANRALRTLSAANLALVRATREDTLLKTIADIIVKQGGYELVGVCYADDNPEKSIRLMAWSGAEEKYLWVGHPTWADTEEGQLPIAGAIRSGMAQIRLDIAKDSTFKPWRDAALARGLGSNIALPLIGNGKTLGALSIYAPEVNAFDKEEVRLLQELADDLAFGIVTLRARKEQEQHADILRQSLEQSIQAIADTVEARDPYTAGHQRRVSELATAIAKDMGVSENQISGIHLAAIVHDLGKIQIPAEILSKPGKLTNIEYMIIQTHPQAGYDILKNVTFPWPIADIVLQHHEKLDGSGYPQGLKGDQILLESKILAVADVVEAMSSHRPYRAALGIKPALNEIKRGRGTVYDATAVDVCLKLFAGNKFAFSNQ